MSTAADPNLALQLAFVEMEQARMERDQLGINIGSTPPEMQQGTYLAARARYLALLASQVPS